jgi:hypothetical protein
MDNYTEIKKFKTILESVEAQSMTFHDQDMEEGNEFSGARAAAIKAGKDTFTVDGKTYHVTGDKKIDESAYTYKDDEISDLHKDVYGYRPKEHFWNEWHNATADEKQDIWNGLVKNIDSNDEEMDTDSEPLSFMSTSDDFDSPYYDDDMKVESSEDIADWDTLALEARHDINSQWKQTFEKTDITVKNVETTSDQNIQRLQELSGINK